MPTPPQATGFFVILVAVVLAVIETFADHGRDLSMLIWALLVLGSAIVLAPRTPSGS